jgi:hypothetical protein
MIPLRIVDDGARIAEVDLGDFRPPRAPRARIAGAFEGRDSLKQAPRHPDEILGRRAHQRAKRGFESCGHGISIRVNQLSSFPAQSFSGVAW